jgi:hypothetical protein
MLREIAVTYPTFEPAVIELAETQRLLEEFSG